MGKIDLNDIDGLIWDMDGILVDVNNSYRAAIRATAEKILNRPVDRKEVDDVKKLVGMNNDWDATYALVYGENDYKNIHRTSDEYKKIYQTFQHFYIGDINKPGLIDNENLLIDANTLRALKDKYNVMAIATGRPKYEADYVLKKNNLKDIFDLVVAMEDTDKGKPFPDPILKVTSTLSLKNSVYIGDTVNDVIAAKEAGVQSLFVGNETLGDYNFPDIRSLIQFLV